jgi:hypothetical protein
MHVCMYVLGSMIFIDMCIHTHLQFHSVFEGIYVMFICMYVCMYGRHVQLVSLCSAHLQSLQVEREGAAGGRRGRGSPGRRHLRRRCEGPRHPESGAGEGMYVCMHVCMYVCMHVCTMCVCVCVYMYVCMYVCMEA